jgi:hypothetical protein
VFRHQRQEGSCDNLRVRRGGRNSGSGVIVRTNIFGKFNSMVKHHAITYGCKREL